MSYTAPPKSVPKPSPTATPPGKGGSVGPARQPAGKPASTGHGPRPTTLFEIPFASAMSDPDIALLARTLYLTTHMSPKLSPNPNGPGTVRLDHDSGLFLERRASEGQWALVARTWGQPDPELVHEWQVLAAGAARLLDPGVVFLERLPVVASEHPVRPVGRAANTRHARIGRRLRGV